MAVLSSFEGLSPTPWEILFTVEHFPNLGSADPLALRHEAAYLRVAFHPEQHSLVAQIDQLDADLATLDNPIIRARAREEKHLLAQLGKTQPADGLVARLAASHSRVGQIQSFGDRHQHAAVLAASRRLARLGERVVQSRRIVPGRPRDAIEGLKDAAAGVFPLRGAPGPDLRPPNAGKHRGPEAPARPDLEWADPGASHPGIEMARRAAQIATLGDEAMWTWHLLNGAPLVSGAAALHIGGDREGVQEAVEVMDDFYERLDHISPDTQAQVRERILANFGAMSSATAPQTKRTQQPDVAWLGQPGSRAIWS